MKNIIKKISSILILMAGISIGLVGCGTGEDSSSMGSTSKNPSVSI
jgi:hypothetical protein